jgi:hypothetical protein
MIDARGGARRSWLAMAGRCATGWRDCGGWTKLDAMANAWRYLDPAPPPPPGRPIDRMVYGLMQPILGARVLLRERRLLRSALIPVAWLAGVCALWGLLHVQDGPRSMVRHFYQTFAVLAPLPSVLLAGHYARMVVQARVCLQLPAAEPYVESLWRCLRRAIAQAILIGVAIAPATLLLGLLPLLGDPLIRVAAALWALHWIVIDAFDATRVHRPGQPPPPPRQADAGRCPWFVRALYRTAPRIPIGGGILRRFARLCDRLAHPWREEIAVVEDHPALVLGFSLTTAALLATPVLNLFFRPIVLVGAVHVLGRLDEFAGPAALPAMEPAPAAVSNMEMTTK